jgi:hypothetical protein
MTAYTHEREPNALAIGYTSGHGMSLVSKIESPSPPSPPRPPSWGFHFWRADAAQKGHLREVVFQKWHLNLFSFVSNFDQP